MLMHYAFTLDTVFKSVPPKGSELTWQTSMLSSCIVLLIHVNRTICMVICLYTDFPGGSDGKASVYNVRDLGSIPGWGRFPGEGNGNPLQYSCLENPMDRGAWCRLLSMGLQRVRHDWMTSLHLWPTGSKDLLFGPLQIKFASLWYRLKLRICKYS